MFTGIVAATGTVVERKAHEEGVRFGVDAPGFAETLVQGESVSVDGVCQTVTERADGRFSFESIRTTLSRTTLDGFREGRRVNLERAVRAGEPLGGHLIQGHVDGVAPVLEIESAGETTFLRLELPAPVARLTVALGSLAVDGVSLTVNRLDEDVAEMAIIPYTWTHTALSRLGPGDRVNVEADLIAKYVARLLERRVGTASDGGKDG